jgi:hypothetical protein
MALRIVHTTFFSDLFSHFGSGLGSLSAFIYLGTWCLFHSQSILKAEAHKNLLIVLNARTIRVQTLIFRSLTFRHLIGSYGEHKHLTVKTLTL